LNAQGIDVPIAAFDSTKLSANKASIQNYLHAASGLVINGKCQNFLNQYSSQKRKGAAKEDVGNGTLAVMITFIVMLLVTLICFVFRIIKQEKLFRLEAENTSQDVIEQVAEYDELLERNVYLNNQYDAIADVDENLNTYPVCNNKIIDLIQNCAGNYATVQFDSFDADAGLVMVTARSENVDNIYKFIRELNGRDIFQSVD
jgi:hypothetical protein